MNTSLSPDERANLLLAASSLQQQMRWLDEKAANNPTVTSGGVLGRTATYPVQVNCAPYINYADGPWGISGPTGVTAFPVPVALAASWDLSLSAAKGAAQADEGFHKGDNGILGPGLDDSRTPFGGRNSEYMGEDPVLAGYMAASWIQAAQSIPGEPVLMVMKHYLGNDQEINRQTSSDVVDDRTVHELNGLFFEIPSKQSQPGGTMCSYNGINGTYMCENPYLNTHLKGQIGFPGYVVTDFGSIHSTAPSLLNGLDQELNVPNFFSPTNLQAALDAGQISTTNIFNAAHRVVRSYFATGLFDTPMPTPSTIATTPASLAVALQSAEEGSVLLQNNGNILPLTKRGQRIALIGPTASTTVTNGISAVSVCTASAGRVVSCPVSTTTGAAVLVDPLTAITSRAAALGDTVTWDNGSDLNSVANTAATADVVIVFGYNTEGEGADLPNLNLFTGGDALIQAAAAANPNTVVVLETGSAVLTPWSGQVQAILEAWYPGVQQGPALAALLFGDVNFSGKLPVTFMNQLADLPTGIPSNLQYPGSTVASGTPALFQVYYSEGLLTGYRWYDSQGITPKFPFGYGLSYTTFGYSNMTVNVTKGAGNVPSLITATFNVTNTGSVKGSEVAQVYVSMPTGIGEPPRRLVGWSRVNNLAPGLSQTVTVTIDPASAGHPLSYWDVSSQAWIQPKGTLGIYIGGSSRSLPLLYKYKSL